MPDLDALETLERELGPALRELRPDPPADLHRRTARPARRERRPLLVPALAVAATVLTALVVAAGVLIGVGGDDEISGLSGGGQSESAGSSAAPSAPTGVDDGAGRSAPPVTGPDALGAVARAVERSASLALGAEDVDGAAAGVGRAARSAGGFVADAQVSTSAEGGSAAFTLRVPSAQLDALLGRLSELGEVQSLERSELDVTGRLSDAQRLLADARDERRALLRSLGATADPARVRALRARLADVGRSIDRRERAVRRVQRRADVATVSVTIAGDQDGGGVATPLGVLRGVTGAMLLAAAATGPPLLALLLVLLGWRTVRRRRREAALA